MTIEGHFFISPIFDPRSNARLKDSIPVQRWRIGCEASTERLFVRI